MIKAKILGTGFYVPNRVVTNDELVQHLNTTDEWIRTKIGVLERHFADDSETTSDMALCASNRALDSSGIDATDLDMIVLATCSPDNIVPATAIKLQEKLGANKAFAFDIKSGGCSGFVYGLSVAEKYIKDGTCSKVLVVAADKNTQYIDPEDRTTSVIIADGACAAVLMPSDNEGIISTKLYSDPSGYCTLYIPAGGTAEPYSETAIKNRDIYLKMDGHAVFNFATRVFPESVCKLLEENSVNLLDIDWVISHQANINIIKKSMEQLGLPMTKTYCNIEKYGNTGGPSIGIAFAEAIAKGIIKKGDTIVLVAYGAGLSWGAILLTL